MNIKTKSYQELHGGGFRVWSGEGRMDTTYIPSDSAHNTCVLASVCLERQAGEV